ncbi:MAG: PP2C family protein-serine/threonine phosphatase [Bacteroidota bacterium]
MNILPMIPQNKEIEKLQEYKEAFEEQKLELTKSIRYAQNIQKAIFPPEDHFKNIFKHSFILFKPKELVSGDFYWVRQMNNKIIVAAGDCTGHGVPGAFMSILGITFLNEITNYEPLMPSNKILNNLRERIMKTLNQTGEESEQKDGMDLALFVYDKNEQTLDFSGANNTMYHYREQRLSEIKGDRMPIGVSGVTEESFQRQTINIKKGDQVYIFTDGFVDQFGGENSGKFKYKRLRKILSEIQSYDFPKQHNIMEQTFYDWKGDNEQVDDVLVIGIGFHDL